MKILTVSDIHGSSAYCRLLCDRIDEFDPDVVLLLGDLLYHGPRNALPDGYDPARTAKLLNAYADRIIAVKGNCDSEVDSLMLDFPLIPDFSLLIADDTRIYISHGHKFGAEEHFPMKNGSFFLSGHTHVPDLTEKDGVVFMNPGSVSIPKKSSCRSYMTYSGGVFCWRELDGGNVYKRYEK